MVNKYEAAADRVSVTVQVEQALGAEDAAILELESPRIAGHTCKVATVEPPAGEGRLEPEDLRAHVAGRLGREPRLMQKLSGTEKHPAWVVDKRFQIENHVVRFPTDRPADRKRLLEIVAELMAGRLDRSRPLWSFHLVDLEAKRTAIVMLIHHCMADGMAAVRLCSQVLWDPVGKPGATGGHHLHHHAPLLHQSKPSLRSIVRRELMPRGSETPLDRHPSAQRRVAVAEASLVELGRIGKEVGEGATVNDVVLCAVAGGLRGWLEHHGGSLQGVRVKVPVSLHQHDERTDQLGNHDSFMIVDVGTEEPDPARRLRLISQQTRERKTDHDAQALDHVFSELRRVSAAASDLLTKWSNSPRIFAINVSNVPGPSAPVAVAGREVSDLFTLAEISDRHALRVAAISMDDEITFGLLTDAQAVADPQRIANGIEADLAALASIPAS